jgi:hypothetical protein
MDFSPFDVLGMSLGIIGVLGIWGVISLGNYMLTKLEMHP